MTARCDAEPSGQSMYCNVRLDSFCRTNAALSPPIAFTLPNNAGAPDSAATYSRPLRCQRTNSTGISAELYYAAAANCVRCRTRTTPCPLGFCGASALCSPTVAHFPSSKHSFLTLVTVLSRLVLHP